MAINTIEWLESPIIANFSRVQPDDYRNLSRLASPLQSDLGSTQAFNGFILSHRSCSDPSNSDPSSQLPAPDSPELPPGSSSDSQASNALLAALMNESASVDQSLWQVPSQPITPENFRPFGQVIFANPDGMPFSQDDAQLVLHQGTPRFYIMRLQHRGRQFSRITRHLQCTQCLGALEGKSWLLAVAPPGAAARPQPSDIQAFVIPGNCFVKLEVGTWHAGPYFDAETVDFYNLELSDTNEVDHDTCDLQDSYGLTFEIV